MALQDLTPIRDPNSTQDLTPIPQDLTPIPHPLLQNRSNWAIRHACVTLAVTHCRLYHHDAAFGFCNRQGGKKCRDGV